MRRTGPARSASLLAIALVVAACASEPTPVDGDAGSSDASWIDCAPVPCGPRGYVCREGRVLRRVGSVVSRCDPAGRACEEVEHETQCELGCVEGATGLQLEAVCRWREPGDRCAAQADCEPHAEPAPALRCDLVNGVCVVPGPEVCNGVDDDGDGVTDPACLPPPPRLALVPFEGSPERVAFGPDRIALLSSDAAGARTVQVVDSAGAPVVTHELRGTPRALAYLEGELVVLLREASEAPLVVRLRDDGARSAVALALGVPGEPLSFTGDAEGWTLAAPLSSGAGVGLTRHAPTGERVAMRRHDGWSGLRTLVRAGSTTWIELSPEGVLAHLTPSLGLEPAAWPASVAVTWGTHAHGDELVALGQTLENEIALVRLDAAGSSSVRVLEPSVLDFRARFAIDATRNAVWLCASLEDRLELEGLRLDDGLSIARFAVHRAHVGVAALGAPSDDGTRLVVAHAREWSVHALRASDPATP